MKKAASGSGSLHLYRDVDVRRLRGTQTAESLCGSVEHGGPFTALMEDAEDVDGLCGNCRRAADEE